MLDTKITASADGTGTVITATDTTGDYSTDNPGGYGTPNPAKSAVMKLVYELTQYDSDVDHRLVFVRDYDSEKPFELITPAIDDILNGEPVTLNSINLQITEPSEGLVPFRDDVWDVNRYSIVEAFTGVTGNAGDPFIIGSGLDDIAYLNDAILVGDDLYNIDKTKDTNGGTVLYLEEELKTDLTEFNPAYRGNVKVLVDAQSWCGLRYLAGKTAECDPCDGCHDVYKEKLFDVTAFMTAAQSQFSCGFYESAHTNIQTSYRISKSCNCKCW